MRNLLLSLAILPIGILSGEASASQTTMCEFVNQETHSTQPCVVTSINGGLHVDLFQTELTVTNVGRAGQMCENGNCLPVGLTATDRGMRYTNRTMNFEFFIYNNPFN